MFTGIVEQLGTLLKINRQDEPWGLTIGWDMRHAEAGDSIAVNGICFTIVEHSAEHFYCEASYATRQATTIEHWQEGQLLHLETPVQAGQPFGGHFVTGHVDDVIFVDSVHRSGECLQVNLSGVHPSHRHWLYPKGSVAIDGVSLTLNQMTSSGFNVMLVSETLRRTHFNDLVIGKPLNIEYDMLAKMVNQQLQQQWDGKQDEKCNH